MKSICLVNQKGGVSKTTTTVSLGAILAEMGHRVLLVDMDPQGNATEALGVESEYMDNTIYEVMTKGLPFKEGIHSTEFGVDIMPSNINLANTELDIANAFSRETILKKSFENSDIDYDFVLFDLPPALGLLSINSLALADYVLIPLDAGVFSLSGIDQLINIVKLVKNNLNDKLDILGVLLAKADDRINLTKEMREALIDIFGDKVFDTYIHQNSRMMESQKARQPINIFDKNSRSCKEYKELAKEVVERVKR